MMTIKEFQGIDHDEGFLRPSSDGNELRSYGNGRFAGLEARTRNPGSTANKGLRQQFFNALKGEYGDAFANTQAAKINVTSGDPLTASMVREVIRAADLNRAQTLQQAELLKQTQHQQSTQLAETLTKRDAVTPSSMQKILQEEAEKAGFTTRIDQFNKDSVKNGTNMKLSMEDTIKPDFERGLRDRIALLSKGGTVVVTQSMAEDEMRLAIQDSEIFDRKMEVLNAIDSNDDLTPAQKDFALDAGIRNTYPSAEDFQKSYFRAPSQGVLKTPLRGKATAYQVQQVPSLDQAMKGLTGKKYDEGTYDPSSYFKAIVSGGADPMMSRDPKFREFNLNTALMNQAMFMGGTGEEARNALAQRMGGYQFKFANYAGAEGFNNLANPFQVSADSYFRTGTAGLSGMLDQQVASSLGVPLANVRMVTDSRFMETVKRDYNTTSGADVLDWNEKNLGAIYDHMASGKPMFLDTTAFFGATTQSHTDHPEDLKEAMEVANGFMTDVLTGGVDDYLKTDPKFASFTKEQLAEEKNKILNNLNENLTLGAMLKVGENSALYTAKLGTRSGPPGRQVYTQGEISEKEAKNLRELAYHNGYNLGPQQVFDQWIRSSPDPETMLGNLNAMTMNKLKLDPTKVQFPTDVSRLARFDSPEDFTKTKIFKDFQALGNDVNAPPYVKIMAKTTTAMMGGLKDMDLHNSFAKEGLEPMLQINYNRMQAAMQNAVLNANDPAKFREFLADVETMHEQMSTLTAVARPFKESEFNGLMNGAVDLMPKDFDPGVKPQFALKNSGMRCLASVMSGAESVGGLTPGKQGLNIAVQKDCYYESSIAMSSSLKNKTMVLDGEKIDETAGKMHNELGGTDKDGPKDKLDMYVAEFHHNISDSRSDYKPEDVTAQVDAMFDKGLVSDRFTVAIDNTIATTNSDKIQAFLKHNEQRIKDGKLNVVLYRSAQKFDMMGLDNFNGGIMTAINNGNKEWDVFNKSISQDVGLGQDELSSYNVQGLSHFQKYAQGPLNEYRQGIMDATKKIMQPRSATNPVGLPGSMSLDKAHLGKEMIQIAPSTDPNSVFIDLRNPHLPTNTKAEAKMAEDFAQGIALTVMAFSKDHPEKYHVETRPSFGFPHSNMSLISGSKFRFNPGLEDDATLQRYSELLSGMNNVLKETQLDYPDPSDFNKINYTIVTDTKNKNGQLLIEQQLKLDKGEVLTPAEQMQRAGALTKMGNFRGAQRTLDTLGKTLNLPKELKTKLKELQGELTDASKLAVEKLGPPKSANQLGREFNEQGVVLAKMLREPDADRMEILGQMGKLQETSQKLGGDSAGRIRNMLSRDFKQMAPRQLELISSNAEDACIALGEKNPMRGVMKDLSKFAQQDIVLAQALANPTITNPTLLKARTDKEVQDRFLTRANTRDFQKEKAQAPEGDTKNVGDVLKTGGEKPKEYIIKQQNVFGDLYASMNNDLQDKSGPIYLQPGKTTPDGDLIIDPNGQEPEQRLMAAIKGFALDNATDMNKTAGNEKVKKATVDFINSLPVEQQVIHSSRGMDGMAQLFHQQGPRSMHLSYSEVLKNAMKGDAAGFVHASKEFLDKVNVAASEFEFTAKVLTDPKYLATLPKEHRDTARKFGEHAGRLAKELKNPDGITQRAKEFLANAIEKPGEYMKLAAERIPLPSLKQDVGKKDVRAMLAQSGKKVTRSNSVDDLGQKPPSLDPTTAPQVKPRSKSLSSM